MKDLHCDSPKISASSFEEYTERRGTSSYKWDDIPGAAQVPGVLPFWVADMDFPCPPKVREALEKRARHGIFGYHFRSPEYVSSVRNWILNRHKWKVPEELLVFTPPGVVYAIDLLVRQLTKPGDPVLIHTPAYTPLLETVVLNERKVVASPLVYSKKDSRFHMNFEDMEEKIRKHSIRFMLFCSPHNPTGRVWSREELLKIEAITSRHDITVLSDEIHGDLIYPGERHIPFGSLSAYTLEKGITIFSATKSFNLGGLQGATVITGNPEIRRNLSRTLQAAQTRLDNIFGAVATQTAYET
ncbi:MAG TPA: aminotransferase class I/II-fold pyridoxal phosphate-dependent enzyme, partial [Synergistaceae bacterium]|nr:aminotransferase class I/II-fold pyridoxal phosphate-dependent enzyme [Synergistaceae bacterium]